MTVKTLICYDHEDKRMVTAFKRHLSSLERNGLVTVWDSGMIAAGAEWKQTMDTYLNEAEMILLLMSASFFASNSCYTVQMKRAIERHEDKKARVIPILLRSVYWQEPPLDKLQALPDGKKPISKWTPQDDGFENVVVGLAKIVKLWNEQALPDPTPERKTLMADLVHLIETVKTQLQPPQRALATAKTLQQLSILIPNGVTLADLVVGWRILSQSPQQEVEEEIAIARRRLTCGELAELGSQFTTGQQGDREQAIKTWQAWQKAFEKSDDQREQTMASTFEREARELQV